MAAMRPIARFLAAVLAATALAAAAPLAGAQEANCFDNEAGDGRWETAQDWSLDKVPWYADWNNSCRVTIEGYTVSCTEGGGCLEMVLSQGADGPPTALRVAMADPSAFLRVEVWLKLFGGADLDIASGTVLTSHLDWTLGDVTVSGSGRLYVLGNVPRTGGSLTLRGSKALVYQWQHADRVWPFDSGLTVRFVADAEGLGRMDVPGIAIRAGARLEVDLAALAPTAPATYILIDGMRGLEEGKGFSETSLRNVPEGWQAEVAYDLEHHNVVLKVYRAASAAPPAGRESLFSRKWALRPARVSP
jgi:hypothetical protein